MLNGNQLIAKKDGYEIIIKNIKLFTKKEEDEIINIYLAKDSKIAQNRPNLRKHLEIASYYEQRTIITFDITIVTLTKQLNSNIAIIIKYDEHLEMLYDIFDKITKNQRDQIWALRVDILGLFEKSINQENYDLFLLSNAIKKNEKEYSIKTYSRNSKVVFLCLIREILVQATEEERIRQKVLLSLLTESNIPADYILVENHLSHFSKGSKNRADIIILHPKTKEPWILYELKEPNKPILHETLLQAKNYNKYLNCKYICLFNGIKEEWFLVVNEETNRIHKPETIEDLFKEKIKYKSHTKYIRPSYKELNDEKVIIKHMYGKNVIGDNTPKWLYSFIINFYGFLREEKSYIFNEYKTSNFTIINDGIRFTSFGNAGGGEYDGIYRYFVIKFPNGENNIVSISIFGTGGGYTSLIVALDDFEKRHPSLQLNIDNNVQLFNSRWKVFHDGKLTQGKKGMQKKEVLFPFYEDYLPDLIKNNKIYLGEIPSNVNCSWENSKELIINLIRYALIRDKYRSENK